MSQLLIPSNLTKLPDSAEFIVTTNLKSPIKITGVAITQLRNSKDDPWRKGFMVFYEEDGVINKAEVNKELYEALHLVFDTLGNMSEHGWFLEEEIECKGMNNVCLR